MSFISNVPTNPDINNKAVPFKNREFVPVYGDNKAVVSNNWYRGSGRVYDQWIDEGSRNSTETYFSEGLLIRNPVHVVESIIRDELNAEPELRIDMSSVTTGSKGSLPILGCRLTATNAYAGARFSFYDPAVADTVDVSDMIATSSYNSSTKVTTVTFVDTVDIVAGSYNKPCKISDIRTHFDQIDTTTFDDCAETFVYTRMGTGSTTEGYDRYPCNLLLEDYASVESVLSDYLYQHFMVLYRDFKTWKIYRLTPQTYVTTFNNPLKKNGVLYMTTNKTSLDTVYNKFKFNFLYDSAEGDFLHTANVNSSGQTFGTMYSTAENQLKAWCANPEDLYGEKVNRELEVNLNAQEHGEAFNMAYNFVRFFTQQRFVVKYVADMQTHDSYNIGQQVRINVPELIPTGLNNSATFIIMSRKIVSRDGNRYFEFELMEVPGS